MNDLERELQAQREEIRTQRESVTDIRHDLKDLKRSEGNHTDRIEKAENRLNLIEKQQALIDQRLKAIEDNTTHTIRLLQQVIFGAVATGVIGGAITLIWANIGGV